MPAIIRDERLVLEDLVRESVESLQETAGIRPMSSR